MADPTDYSDYPPPQHPDGGIYDRAYLQRTGRMVRANARFNQGKGD